MVPVLPLGPGSSLQAPSQGVGVPETSTSPLPEDTEEARKQGDVGLSCGHRDAQRCHREINSPCNECHQNRPGPRSKPAPPGDLSQTTDA